MGIRELGTWGLGIGGKTVLPDEWFKRSIPVIRDHLAPVDRKAFDDVIQRVAGEMRSAATGLSQQLIHRDCHHGNIVVRGEQVSGFVDCDHHPILMGLASARACWTWPISWCTASRGVWPIQRPSRCGSRFCLPCSMVMRPRTPSRNGNGGQCSA